MINSHSISIHKETFPFLNIALYLNHISLINNLTIHNNSEENTGTLELIITSDQPCIETFSYAIDSIPAGKDIKIPLQQLKINRSFISNISETEKAVITISVLQDGTPIANDAFSIDVYPLEYFGGFHVLPELIAAYITPNHPYIYHIKRKAISIMEASGFQTAFEGYQSNNPESVLQIMSSIYSAIQAEQIIYSALPPGYEETGQRLRLLTTIQQEKFANCIDMSLLFAACLEAADLNPVLIIVKNHAFIGCWLQDDKFAEVVNDDKTAITKRLSKGIREMAAVEATSMCKGYNHSFTEAINIAEARMIEKEDFLLSVDIQSARISHIRPLPLLNSNTRIELDETAALQMETSGMEGDFDLGKIYTDELLHGKQAITKQKIWERKLLDLSLRNNLLNLRITRNMLQLVDVDISNLENLLNDGKNFSIIPDARALVQRKYNLFAAPLHQSSPIFQTAKEELKNNRLLTYYHQQDLDNVLTYMHKNAKQAIEENGSSTLYLAIGLLKWYDSKTIDQPRYAPVLLIPVELNRRSVNSKFTLKSREEETMINITLLEFLRQEYELELGTLENLPSDDNGVDVAKLMSTLRHAVMQLKGWDVEEQLILGNFSFNKLILWKDIVAHQEELLKNNMVRSLIEGKLLLDNVHNIEMDADINTVSSQTVALPIATDASQMEAVLAAQKQQSFILHGPPGTGKSQTITNIIADALYRGKRVLFVAAKKAALDVVHKRLQQIGLAPFSLELHSNKSKKSDVLNQLAISLNTARLGSSTDYSKEAERLDAAKKSISDYVDILHEQQPIGWNLYQSIIALEDYKHKKFQADYIPAIVLQQLNKSLWQQWTDWLPSFQSIIKSIIHPTANPLAALHIQQYTADLQQSIGVQCQQIIHTLPLFQQQVQALAATIHFPFTLNNKLEWEQFSLVIHTLKGAPDIPISVVDYLADKENYSICEEWCNHFEKYLSALKTILSGYDRHVLTADIATLEIQWKKALQSWFLPKWLKKRKVKKELSVFSKNPINNEEEIVQLFSDHQQYREETEILKQARFVNIPQSLKSLYKDEQTDINDIRLKMSLIQRLSALILPFNRNGLSSWMQSLQKKGFAYTDDIKSIDSRQWENAIKIATETDKLLNTYHELTGINIPDSNQWIDKTIEQAKQIQLHLPTLKNWMIYVQLCNQANNLQLQWLIQAYEKQLCTASAITDYFHYTVHSSIVHSIIAAHDSLSLFNTALFESKIAQFKKIAAEFQQLTIQELRIKLAAQLPNTTIEAMQSSEIGILQRAIKSRGRGMSIRRLFDQVPTLLPRLAPCMLMSPISVAQYFDIAADPFDLVIFDEASQLPTCEAVSALARAKQAIIVGDPKQMPPTAFFTTTKTDEEHVEIEDLESILDDCLSLSIPSRYLLRHYRSKHESLIAFSNSNYYDNKLLTFPSADDLNRKVLYHHIPGSYDKGKTRTNRFEAEAIVQYIKAHYSHPEKQKLSVGVVTFSQTQQSLVEDKLQDLFMSDSRLEQIANECAEPLFIKNLENVQGDERDIILFSVGYAPDEDGKMSMNFGPLNRNGGWRRLNVAVTRARNEMHVFATLAADQVDLSRSAAEGVAGLKAFLQFAEKGYLPLRSEDLQTAMHTRHLSEAIGKQLQEKGLTVKNHIGTSGFKIDVAIIHPEKPEQYILGIIVDGQYYYNARTANDREMIMPAVLKGLGWNIYRVWTMDWHENAEGIINSIIKKVEQLISDDKVEDDTNFSDTITNEPLKEAELIEITNTTTNRQRPYIAHSLTPITNVGSEAMYDAKNRSRIKQQIQMLVDAEEPISKAWLYKKLLQAWNTSRAGAKLDKHIEYIITEMNLTQSSHQQPFYWRMQTDIHALDYYRNNDTEKRNIEDIAPEEIIVALHEVVQHNLSIEEEELLRYLSRLFGFAKVGKQIEMQLRYAIDIAEQKGKIKREGKRVKIAEIR